MIRLSELSLRRGSKLLLEDAQLTIHVGWRVGIVGVNGTGKSSLFALLQGYLSADKGEIELDPHWKLAHVAQETPPAEISALDYVINGDAELRKLQQELEIANETQIGTIITELENIDAYTAESRATKLLYGLGFKTGDENRMVREFSGGWRMRLNLAQALMCRSDLLLLDEPTNHLDLDAILWLEQWLEKYQGTLLLISHDREFLDQITTHIVHLHNQNLNIYTGNYSNFEQAYAQAKNQQQAAHMRQQVEIDKLNKFVERFRAKATKAKQAQSRLKTLEKMALIAPVHDTKEQEFAFATPDRLPNPLLSIEQAAIGYNESALVEKINLSLFPGDRLGLLGPNGAGKSTLIKLLADEIKPLQGKRQASPHLVTGYFAQHQLEQLDTTSSPMVHLRRIDGHATEQVLRTHLGKFSFSGDQALTPVETFSGGEKARLVLAMICYSRPNLLLLDEPTNHLDLEMRRALSVALNNYEGAVVLVSHDRFLINAVCDQILLIADGRAEKFDGDQEEYARWLANRRAGSRKSSSQDNTAPSSQQPDQKRKQAADQRQKIKRLGDRIARLEKEHNRITKMQSQILEELGMPSLYEPEQNQRLKKLLEQQAALDEALIETETAWIEANEHLENEQS